jgi:dTDP-4-dehydrorhamnose 3,5-epimerase-like enzyme
MKFKLIELPKNTDKRGNLSFLQNTDQVPFEIKRVFWIYDVPGGEIRGGHAYKEQQEVIIALSGSFDVVVFDGEKEEKFQLNRSYYGLYLPAGIWRHMENFSTNALSFHLSDKIFNENDYIRDINSYKLNYAK